MTKAAVILYGPPCSGKDTITGELSSIARQYTLFERLKAGPGRAAGYRPATLQAIEELRRAGHLLYRNARYGAEYAIDRLEMAKLLENDRTPILHMGQVAGIRAVTRFPADWTLVLLWCPYGVTKARCSERGDRDLDARLRVWEETRSDLLDNDDVPWSLVISTDRTPASEAAQAIAASVASGAVATLRDIRSLVG